MTNEEMILWTTASLRMYVDGSNIGLPVTYQSQEEDNRKLDQVEINIDFTLRRRGSFGEDYGILIVTATIRTRVVDSDVYYHTRVTSRVAEVLSQPFPCKRAGFKGADKAVVGILRPIPSDSTNLGAVRPNQSVVEVMYEFQPC